jgi:hypothetical protein
LLVVVGDLEEQEVLVPEAPLALVVLERHLLLLEYQQLMLAAAAAEVDLILEELQDQLVLVEVESEEVTHPQQQMVLKILAVEQVEVEMVLLEQVAELVVPVS